MTWFKKTCSVCGDKHPKCALFHEIRAKTADGVISIEICEECAIFFDKSSEIIMKGRQDEQQPI